MPAKKITSRDIDDAIKTVKEKRKKMKFDKIKQIIAEYLHSVLDVDDFKITYAKQEPTRWLINVNFKEYIDSTSKTPVTISAAIIIDSVDGNLIEIRKFQAWT